MTKDQIVKICLTTGHLHFGELAEGETFRDFAENVAEKIVAGRGARAVQADLTKQQIIAGSTWQGRVPNVQEGS